MIKVRRVGVTGYYHILILMRFTGHSVNRVWVVQSMRHCRIGVGSRYIGVGAG